MMFEGRPLMSHLLSKDEILRRQERLRLSFPEVMKTSISVLKIIALGSNRIGKGSGVVLEGGSVVTAAHNVRNVDNLILISPLAVVGVCQGITNAIKADEETDVASFFFPEEYKDIIPPLKPAEWEYGEDIFLLGHPDLNVEIEWPLFGQAPIIQAIDWSRRDGYKIKACFHEDGKTELNGLSGGVFVNRKGEVIGIVHSGQQLAYLEGKSSYMCTGTDIMTAMWVLGI